MSGSWKDVVKNGWHPEKSGTTLKSQVPASLTKRRKFGMSEDVAGEYAIHGGGVPIRVAGVEGIVAVVVVSGLKQHEDHGVIVDVINSNWE
ncbi:hypothetical protein NUW58_g10279 [Xylaria curta]|uniref:Uncharacterized protein n=1 Tax=Xylaria curta TaxID=42375 RepID=A0ACC1MPA6_9PEZI|nr:hypothetical protein NUW58_g10279 [Xylaria curta]